MWDHDLHDHRKIGTGWYKGNSKKEEHEKKYYVKNNTILNKHRGQYRKKLWHYFDWEGGLLQDTFVLTTEIEM